MKLMNKTLYLFLLLPFLVFTISWTPYSPVKQLNGPIKTIIEIKKRHMASDYISVKEYNKDGKIITDSHYDFYDDSDSTFFNPKYKSKNKYPLTVYQDTADLELISKFNFSYTKSGKFSSIIEKRFGRNTGQYSNFYEYNNKDSLILEIYQASRIDYKSYDTTKILYIIVHDTLNKITVHNLDTISLDKIIFNNKNQIDIILKKKFSKYDYPFGQEKRLYNQFGEIGYIENKWFDKSGHLCEKTNMSYAYDEQKKLINVESYKFEEFSPTITNQDIALYNFEGNLIKTYHYTYNDGVLEHGNILTYNTKMDYTSWYWAEYYVDDENQFYTIESSDTILYKYDEYDNWIERVSIRDNDSTLLSRLISYY